ncbi:hypothetical protein KNE206_64950 [Kitasatospora sp. NE20-6]|uniref:hypothetical protein n=1 Tax=Kitasatospora sp. NE20-6 TaxID=2859066 RepID=UPI0034DC54E0
MDERFDDVLPDAAPAGLAALPDLSATALDCWRRGDREGAFDAAARVVAAAEKALDELRTPPAAEELRPLPVRGAEDTESSAWLG